MTTENTSSLVTPSAIGMRYGLLTGLVSIIVSFAIYALQLDQNSAAKFLTTVVLVVGIILAQRNYKQLNAGFMSYGDGMTIGALLSLVVGVLSALFTYVYTHFIDADVMTRAMEKARTDMEARGNMSDAQIDQAMAISAKFTSGPILLIIVLLGSLIFGVIISLITSAIIKNPKPEFE
ncbi:DUF4199 family protein [Hymenobacter sp. HMF4947]|uniref:DUF4199 family protein n=1 Tax=Hymenobacter ginkgonis TaxID=2682976 RepID=A0A7K1TKF2_9BACT|nr:DUF4199 domain-containing protein [Hymenobacter ginkgonis]MVN78894.1 DUF4199 family protein [Hymenobacter ginkgonis]